MLDPLDDYPIHQTPMPLVENSLGPNAYDRYFFNGYNADGSVFFSVAFGVYPNKHIVDGALCVVLDGTHHSVFASARLGHDRSNLNVGPLTITIDEPMSQIRVVVDHAEIGLDATFAARTPPIEEPRFVNHQLSIGVFDYTRYTQFGDWSGTAIVDGTSIDLDGLQGCRDRSWGQRGGAGPTAAPNAPQFFWLWTPINFPDGALHLDTNEYEDGSRWHDGGFAAPLLAGDVEPWRQPVEQMRTVDHRLVLEPGTRWLESAELDFTPWRGDPFTVRLTPLARFQMSGVGYGHAKFRHGNWVGEAVVETERKALADYDPTELGNFHVQHIVKAEVGDRVGVGVAELIILGPYESLGLTGIMDVKPGLPGAGHR